MKTTRTHTHHSPPTINAWAVIGCVCVCVLLTSSSKLTLSLSLSRHTFALWRARLSLSRAHFICGSLSLYCSLSLSRFENIFIACATAAEKRFSRNLCVAAVKRTFSYFCVWCISRSLLLARIVYRIARFETYWFALNFSLNSFFFATHFRRPFEIRFAAVVVVADVILFFFFRFRWKIVLSESRRAYNHLGGKLPELHRGKFNRIPIYIFFFFVVVLENRTILIWMLYGSNVYKIFLKVKSNFLAVDFARQCVCVWFSVCKCRIGAFFLFCCCCYRLNDLRSFKRENWDHTRRGVVVCRRLTSRYCPLTRRTTFDRIEFRAKSLNRNLIQSHFAETRIHSHLELLSLVSPYSNEDEHTSFSFIHFFFSLPPVSPFRFDTHLSGSRVRRVNIVSSIYTYPIDFIRASQPSNEASVRDK